MSLKPFRVTQAHLNFLKEKRIFHSGHPDIPGWLKGGTMYKPRGECIVESYISQRVGPCFNSMGAFSYSRSIFDGVARMGRYCSVGEWSKVMLAAHPMERIGTGGFDYADALPWKAEAIDQKVIYDLKPVYENKDPMVEIGHDVWIANSVHLKRGIKIGTGAVVGACSVVTKDVEPFMVVAGNPARPIRRRFSDDLCERILASEWWQYRPSDLNYRMDTENPERFLDQLDERKYTEAIKPFVSPKFNLNVEFAKITASEVARIKALQASQKKLWPGFGKLLKFKLK